MKASLNTRSAVKAALKSWKRQSISAPGYLLSSPCETLRGCSNGRGVGHGSSLSWSLSVHFQTPLFFFLLFFEGYVSIMKGRDGNRDYRPVASDIHKGQYFILQLFYTATHQSGHPALYCLIHQHLQTVAFLLCSSVSALTQFVKKKKKVVTKAFSPNFSH